MNERMMSRMLCRLGVFLALVGLHPLPAHAEAPAPHEVMRLDDRLLRTTRVRITTPSGWLVAEGAREPHKRPKGAQKEEFHAPADGAMC